jgi:hypothetical protein
MATAVTATQADPITGVPLGAVDTTAGEAFGAGDVGKPVAISLNATKQAIHATSLAAIEGVVVLGSTVALNGAIRFYQRCTVTEVDLPNAGPAYRGVYGHVGGAVDLDAPHGRKIGQIIGFGRAQGLATDQASPDWTGQLGGTPRPGAHVNFNVA